MTELTELLSDLGMEDFLKTFDPDLLVKDFSAVHEAYQFLTVEYVEKVRTANSDLPNINLLNIL